MKNKSLSKKASLTALFSALICATAFIQIPLPTIGVPIVIQDMTAILAGMLLGPLYGTLSVLLFLVVGIIGLPVFSGKAGFHVISQGLTGGFLVGYLLAAFLAGLCMQLFYKPGKNEKSTKAAFKSWLVLFFAAVIATVALFTLGIARFMAISEKSFIQSISLVLLPFLPGNLIKLGLVVILTKRLHRFIQEITQ